MYNILSPQLAVKVSPFSGEYGGAQKRGSMRACGGGDVNHYMFVVRTNSGTSAYHYLFVVQTYSGTSAYHYLFVVQTYSGSRVDLYRSLYLPAVGAVAQAAEAVASLCGRTCAFSRHCFW